jgi:hypothetical protein
LQQKEGFEMSSSNPQKDTIYIDIDDEITAVIDKLKSSKHKIVALVLPKRATTFQSVVNMKLLKRTSDDAKKHLVLITSEAALMPLAGAVGVHVAKTLLSKPEIPPGPGEEKTPETGDDTDVPLDKTAPVGKLAETSDEDDEAIEVDNSEDESKEPKGKEAKKPKDKSKKIKIPNFDKFRTKLFLGLAALVLLIIGWYFAFMVLPKATVTLKADTSEVDLDTQFTADTNAQKLDVDKGVIPAISKEFRKTDMEKVAATGQKDLGTKATGEVTFSTPCSAQAPTIPKGTAVSTGNLSFITQSSVTLSPGLDPQGGCAFTSSTDVVAQNAGEQYNLSSGKDFTVAGYSAMDATNNDAMSGGTTKIVKVVTQGDIDGAKQKVLDRGREQVPDELANNLKDDGYFALNDTVSTSNPEIASSPKAGGEGNEVTVTVTVVYTMLGVKEDDIKQFTEESAKKKIDTSKQVIRDNGLDEAAIRKQQEKIEGGQMKLSLKTTVLAGPEFNDDSVKEEIAGKKRGEIESMLKALPGIEEVEVSYSPFYVQTTPKNPKKIDIVLEDNN